MARPVRRRNAIAMAASIAFHAVVLTALALHAPKLRIPHEEAGPPEPIIPILIMPRTPPAPPGSTQKPEPIRLHRRRLPHEALPPPNVQPFVAPKEEPTPPPPPPRGPTQPRITVQPSPSSQLSTALRGGAVGCANPELLSPAERERCMERLGRGAGQAPYLPPAMSAEKQADLARAGAARARDYDYKRSAPAAVPATGAPGGRSAADIAREAGSDQPTLRIPF